MESSSPHIAVIGAGLSGAVLTGLLLQAGLRVSVFDKSRGTGGRMASCRLGDQVADLGSPFFMGGSDAFAAWLRQQPDVKVWSPQRSDFEGNALVQEECFVAAPRQSALTRRLLQGADFVPQLRVGTVWPERSASGAGVVLRDEHGVAVGHYDAAVVATPARQATPLLEAVPRFALRAETVAVFPRWVQVLVIPTESGPVAELITGEHPLLLRASNNRSKPGRSESEGTDLWVLEATEEWSQQFVDDSPEQVAERMKAAFFELLPAEPVVLAERTHRWLYARHEGLGEPFLWDAEAMIGACGDWLAVGGVEGAWRSGLLLAQEITRQFESNFAA